MGEEYCSTAPQNVIIDRVILASLRQCRANVARKLNGIIIILRTPIYYPTNRIWFKASRVNRHHQNESWIFQHVSLCTSPLATKIVWVCVATAFLFREVLQQSYKDGCIGRAVSVGRWQDRATASWAPNAAFAGRHEFDICRRAMDGSADCNILPPRSGVLIERNWTHHGSTVLWDPLLLLWFLPEILVLSVQFGYNIEMSSFTKFTFRLNRQKTIVTKPWAVWYKSRGKYVFFLFVHTLVLR